MERYPSPKLATEIHFHYLKIAFNFEQKYFFRNNLKPIIISRRTPKSSAYGFCDISSRFQDIGNFSYFYIYCSISNAVSGVVKCILAASFALGYVSIQLS